MGLPRFPLDLFAGYSGGLDHLDVGLRSLDLSDPFTGTNCIISWRRLWERFAPRAKCVHYRRRPRSNNLFLLPVKVYGHD